MRARGSEEAEVTGLVNVPFSIEEAEANIKLISAAQRLVDCWSRVESRDAGPLVMLALDEIRAALKVLNGPSRTS